jgi:hypothetical protein
MKRFSKIYENSQSEKTYKISATVEIEVKAENEGEAGYLADSILGSIEDGVGFTIENIEETYEAFDTDSQESDLAKRDLESELGDETLGEENNNI